MRNLFIAFLPVLAILACTDQHAPVGKDAQHPISSQRSGVRSSIENFNDFFMQFGMDEAFQLSRIADTWHYSYLNGDLEYVEETLPSSAWTYLYIFEGMQAFPFTKSMDLNENLSREKQVEWVGVENGIWVSYSFEVRADKWYLVALSDQST